MIKDRLSSAIILALCTFLPVSSAEVVDYTFTPVILIHGSGLDSGTWDELINWLREKGYPASYIAAVDIVPNSTSNIIAAKEHIKPAVEKLLNQANNVVSKNYRQNYRHNKIDIVAHSMGAVSGRWYATRIAPDKVRRFISVAGANHGTNSLCGMKGEGNKEMCPAFAVSKYVSKVQAMLNNNPSFNYDETPFGTGIDKYPDIKLQPPDNKNKISYYTIRIDPDEWIKPADSAILDGSGDPDIHVPNEKFFLETTKGNYKFLQNTRHDDLPKDNDVIKFIYKLLTM